MNKKIKTQDIVQIWEMTSDYALHNSKLKNLCRLNNDKKNTLNSTLTCWYSLNLYNYLPYPEMRSNNDNECDKNKIFSSN